MSSSSQDRPGDRLSPLESVVTDSAHENARFASGQSRSSLDIPHPWPLPLGTLGEQFVRKLERNKNDFEQIILAQEELKQQQQVLSRLKAWHDWDENRRKSLRNFILSKIGYPRWPSLPSRDELTQLILYYFPPRAKLKVVICDYGQDRFERFEVELGDFESGKFLIPA